MKRHQALNIFCGSLLGFLSVFGCSGGGGGGGGSTPPQPVIPPSQTVTLQGRVDDGLPHSPIANANCRFVDLQGTQVATASADGSGTFQLVVPLNMQGFVRCTPPSLSHLETSAFVSTAGRTAGEIIANLTVDPKTTLVTAVLTNTHPPDPSARAAELTAALAAGDADLSLLAQASTALYNAQRDNGIDVAFSSGSESDGGSDGGAPMEEAPGTGEVQAAMRAMAGPFRPYPAPPAILRSRWMVRCCATLPWRTFWPMALWGGQIYSPSSPR